MKVKDLIQKLEKCPEDAEVINNNWESIETVCKTILTDSVLQDEVVIMLI